MRYFFARLTTACVLVASALPDTAGESSVRPQLRIGILAPLTGAAAEYGALVVAGARLAAEELQGDGLSLELYPEDDQCQGRAGISAYTALMNVKKVDLILGPLCNAVTVPLMPIAERDGALLITVGLATADILTAGDSVFNLLPPVAAVADRIANFGYEQLGRRRAALLYLENEFGEENRRVFSETFSRRGGRVVSEQSFPIEERDLRPLLAKVKHDGSDVLYMAGYVPHYTVLVKQMAEFDIKMPLLAASTCQSWQLLEALQGKTAPLYFAHPGSSSSDPYRRLSAAFLAKQPEAQKAVPMLYLGGGYDGITLIARAARNCRGAYRSCIARELSNLTEFVGANGPIRFDAKGNNSAHQNLEIRTVRGGAFVAYAP